MTILVTGGAGYIGSHTCVELLNGGYDVIVADNLSNSSLSAITRIKEIAGRDFPFYEIDVCHEAALEQVFTDHAVDGVIHFAGLKAVGESVAMPIEYYQNNLSSTLTLCRVMKKYGVSRFIFSSSATVYRSDNPMPLTEDAATGCTNPYGWTKYMCEQILRDVANTSPDWSVVLLRYFNPIGAHESGKIGEDPSGIPNNLMPYISQTAIGRREMLSIYGNDYDTADGTGVRDYIHVVSLARGHMEALKFCFTHSGVEIFNLGTGQGTSVLQMVEAFQRINNVKIPYKITDRRPGDVAVCYADPSKAERVLGWRADKSLDDMCADVWRWQSMNPNGYEDSPAK